MKSDIYLARLENLKNVQGRCTLRLYVFDLNKNISIDIHDLLHETLGISSFSNAVLKKILTALPSELNVLNENNEWKILNEYRIFSNRLASVWLNI